MAALFVEFRNWYGRDWPSEESFRAGVERLMRADDAEYLLAAGAGEDTAAGVCQLRYRYGVWWAAEDCWLEDLYVSESARGAGLGSALVGAAVERARERGAARIELDVSESNAAGRALYGRLGFSERSKATGGRDLFMGLRLGSG